MNQFNSRIGNSYRNCVCQDGAVAPPGGGHVSGAEHDVGGGTGGAAGGGGTFPGNRTVLKQFDWIAGFSLAQDPILVRI